MWVWLLAAVTRDTLRVRLIADYVITAVEDSSASCSSASLQQTLLRWESVLHFIRVHPSSSSAPPMPAP